MEYAIATPESTIDRIAGEINKALEHGSVLLMLSGGSNIHLAVSIRQKLKIANQLTISLVDERYGPAGHKDSNWTQLLDAGFDTTDLTVMPVLHGESIEQTAHNFSILMSNAIASHNTVIGVFGLGTDGHTAGILPGSPALNETEIVSYFEAEDFQRITLTAASFKFFNLAFLVAFGESKRSQLERLTYSVPSSDQPAQALKSIPHLVVMSDQIGEE